MYSVEMRREGIKMGRINWTPPKHTYIIGQYPTIEEANFYACVEMLARAGKYNAYLLDINEVDIGPVEYVYSDAVLEECEKIYGPFGI